MVKVLSAQVAGRAERRQTMIPFPKKLQRSPQLLLQAAEEKRGARHLVNIAGGLVAGSVAIMFAVKTILFSLVSMTREDNQMPDMQTMYLIYCISYLSLALLPILYVLGSSYSPEQLLPFQKRKDTDLSRMDMLFLCAVSMALILLANAPVQLVAMLQQALGMSGKIPDMPLDRTTATQILYFGYSVILAPLVEEVLFRGAVLGCLRKYGDWFAIIMSALMFGLYHGNVGQFVFASLIGVILGYLRVRTGSLLPGILLHLLNNLLPTAGAILLQNYGENFSEQFTNGYMAVFLIAGTAAFVLRLIVKGPHSFAKLTVPRDRTAATLSERLCGLFTSAGGLIVLIYGVAFSIYVMVQV